MASLSVSEPVFIVLLALAISLALASLLTLAHHFIFSHSTRLVSGEGGGAALAAISATYGLMLSLVLASSLGTFQYAEQQSNAEADTVVLLSNLAQTFPASASTPFRQSLVCYARGVVDTEYPALVAARTVPLSNQTLQDLFDRAPRNTSGSNSAASAQTMMQQLSNLTTNREDRIRAARTGLPIILWFLVLGGGVVLMVSIAAVVHLDRAWARFAMLFGVALVIVTMVLVIEQFQHPFVVSGIARSTAPMRSALATVSTGVPSTNC